MVILPGNDAGNGSLQRDRPQALATAPQPLVLLMTIGKVAHHSRKSLQFSACVFDGHGDGIRPESRPVFLDLPAFSPHVTFGRDPIELLLQLDPRRTVARIEKRYMLA